VILLKEHSCRLVFLLFLLFNLLYWSVSPLVVAELPSTRVIEDLALEVEDIFDVLLVSVVKHKLLLVDQNFLKGLVDVADAHYLLLVKLDSKCECGPLVFFGDECDFASQVCHKLV